MKYKPLVGVLAFSTRYYKPETLLTLSLRRSNNQRAKLNISCHLWLFLVTTTLVLMLTGPIIHTTCGLVSPALKNWLGAGN